jgi:hypothetical protein
MSKARLSLTSLILGGAVCFALSLGAAARPPQVQPRPAAVVELISEVDLSCSFLLVDAPTSFRIASSARGNEKSVLTDFDLFYVDSGSAEMSPEKAWTVLEYGPMVRLGERKDLRGIVAFKRGRARFVRMEGDKAQFRIEKACGPIMVGYGLVPVAEAEPLRGTPLAWDVPFQGGEVLTGRIVFLDNDLVQIAAGFWAIIDLGAEHGLTVGQQLTVFHQEGRAVPPQAVGNIIVIEAGGRWATVKALSSKDSIRLGDLVQVK